MKRRRAIAVTSLAAVALLPAVGVAAVEPVDAPPAVVYVPTAAEVLHPEDIRVVRVPETGRLVLRDDVGAPLAITSLTVSGPGSVTVAWDGTDFASPSTWEGLGFGQICAAAPVTSDPYVLPDPHAASGSPDLTYRSVIVTTTSSPVVYGSPSAGESVDGRGLPMHGVITCFSSTSGPQVRADDAVAPTSGEAAAPGEQQDSVARPQPLPASPEPTQRPVTRPESRPDVTEPTVDPDIEEPTESPEIEVSVDEKVTICHRTNSPSNPYTLMTIDVSSITKKGHDTHTGPVFTPGMTNQDTWGDIIPAFPGYPGMNAGSTDIIANGCVVPTVPPSPSAAPTRTPSVTPTETPSSSPTPTSTPPASTTPSASTSPESTSTPIVTSTPEASESAGPSTTPEATPTPVPPPAVPVLPIDIKERMKTACLTEDTASLPKSVRQSTVDIGLTNGVSSTTVQRPFVDLYCLANSQPATIEDDLADTGADGNRAVAAGAVLLLAMAAVLAPDAIRRRN